MKLKNSYSIIKNKKNMKSIKIDKSEIITLVLIILTPSVIATMVRPW